MCQRSQGYAYIHHHEWFQGSVGYIIFVVIVKISGITFGKQYQVGGTAFVHIGKMHIKGGKYPVQLACAFSAQWISVSARHNFNVFNILFWDEAC
jgi:hypothetical protein